MIAIGFDTVLFLLIGAVLGYIIGKLAKVLIALILMLLVLSLLGVAFLNVDTSSLIGSLKPLAEELINLVKSRIEILIGFTLGLLIGIAK